MPLKHFANLKHKDLFLYVRLMDLKEQIFLDFETVDIDISLDCLLWGKSFGRRFVPSALKGTKHKKSKDPPLDHNHQNRGEEKYKPKNGKA